MDFYKTYGIESLQSSLVSTLVLLYLQTFTKSSHFEGFFVFSTITNIIDIVLGYLF